ncbi:hypothetical protein RQP46_009934 [Phenoliferia psychrophenolica]
MADEFDPDLELDLDDLSNSLSGGPGTTGTGTGVGTGGGGLGTPLDSDGATPLRRSQRGGVNPTASSNRLSLAFELASAASPNKRASNRELLRSLGIDEDPSEGEDDDDEGDEDRSDEDQDDFLDDSGYGNPSPHPPAADSPTTTLKARQSTASLHNASSPSLSLSMSSPPPFSHPTDTEEDDALARSEADAAFALASSALESALVSTGEFLSHLRQHTAVDPSSSTSPPPLSPSPFNTTFAALSTTLPKNGEAPVADYTDRQPHLESLASSVIKSMYDITRERESQVRELGELERVLANPSASWQAALSTLDAFPPSTPPPTTTSSPSPLSLSTSTPPPPAPFPTAARVELSNLRDITSSLISALSSVHEVTQVNSAGVGEAGRKLRALRGHLGNAKEDLVGLERSERHYRFLA